MRGGDFADRDCQLRGGQQRIAAKLDRGGAGVRILAFEHDIEPALTKRAFDHTDGFVFVFEHRALLDMGFEVVVKSRCGIGAGSADRGERFTHRDAYGITLCQAVLDGEGAGIDARAHHHRLKTGAFLVGPDRDRDWLAGTDAGIVEGATYFEPGEHAVLAIEAPATGLRVEVTAHAHRCGSGIGAGADRVEVADGIAPDLAAGLAQPAGHPIAALGLELGERQAPDAAARGGAQRSLASKISV